MTQQILTGYDGSPRSRTAVHWAGAEAARHGAELTVLRVWPWLGPSEPDGPTTDPVRRAEHGDLEAVAREVLAAHPDLTVATQAAAGDTADALVDASVEYDLLVLGSDGPGALADLLGGSVALSVAARASCPVALVREQPDAPEDELPLIEGELPTPENPLPTATSPFPATVPEDVPPATAAPRPAPANPSSTTATATATATAVAPSPSPAAVLEGELSASAPHSATAVAPSPGPAEIVVGVAGESSLPAVEFALAEAARSGGRVRAVHGWELMPFWSATPGWLPPDTDADDQASRIEADLTRALAAARAAHPEVELVVEARLGGAAGGLLSAAEHADLVVLGRRPHLLGHSLGPVAHAAVRNSPAPVVLVPQP
ncbi:universal stress protein [Kitasatospora cineracea]|uniref:Nucleotide-binding universal stress UspA family protein n=1 Tax=Kitasatospora cineracea TaxID=88074 RepID=A0A3N4RMA8_9ACTN|nr:universal stress protein [Kitasatospora cineracea]RPE29527.1 nucleotide-binding universal stress UspA family protein [Kitasatospora cineracea]